MLPVNTEDCLAGARATGQRGPEVPPHALTHCLLCWAGAQGFPGPSACASGAICMLFMMSGILCLSVLPCSVCGIGTLPCSVLLKTPCDYSCGSMTLWGWHTSSRIVLRCLVP